MDRAGIERTLEAAETVECCFPDTWGSLVGRRMPRDVFVRAAERGLSMPNAAFAWNLVGQIENTPFANADTGFPNMHVAPDLASVRPAPWAPGTAFCLMDVLDGPGGPPHPLSTRGMLRRAVAQLKDLGYEAWTASELEFYLLSEDGRPIDRDHRCWSMERGAEYEPVIGEIRSMLLGAGVPVESSQTESGFGQMEINIAPTSPLENADNAAILKYVSKLVARRHGLLATFMPVPFDGAEGSGHHLHLSMRAMGSDANLFETREDLFGAFLAGVLEHAVALTAINLPSVNAYKRLADYTFAPNRVSWAKDNRTVAVRVPAGEPGDRRLEIRMASADANPYLISAAALATGADGLARGLAPPPATEGDAYKDPTLERFPRSLGIALDRLEGSAFCKELFGATFLETFLANERREEDAFSLSVSEWERSRYLYHA